MIFVESVVLVLECARGGVFGQYGVDFGVIRGGCRGGPAILWATTFNERQ
jgi:hypothetical protein